MFTFNDFSELKDALGDIAYHNLDTDQRIKGIGFDKSLVLDGEDGSYFLVVPKGVKSFFNGRRGGLPEDVKSLSLDKVVFLIDKNYDFNELPSNNRIVVPSVAKSVVDLLNFNAEKEKCKLVAVTGTVGKTSTRKIISTLLEKNGSIGHSKSNMSYGILKRSYLLSGFDFKLFEVSANALNFSEDIVKSDVAVLTSIGEGHFEKYGNMENIFEIKSRLLSSIKSGGTAVVNCDIPFFEKVRGKLASGVNLITFGEDSFADIKLVDYNSQKSTVLASIYGEEVGFKLGLAGKHNAINALGAIAVMSALGYSFKSYRDAFSKITPVKGRGVVHDLSLNGKRFKLIDDCYNANPLSMKASIEAFSNLDCTEGRKIMVLGDMLELGEKSKHYHDELLDSINSSEVDKVYLVGNAMGDLWSRLNPEVRGAALTKYTQIFPLLRRDMKDGDTVLMKSSNSVGLTKLVSSLVKKLGSKSHD